MENYSAKSIIVLKGLEPVRLRPGMYIGSTSVTGLHHLICEVVDNAIDEAITGNCDRIEVTLEQKDVIRVKDNGRGIPVDTHEKTGKSALEVVMCELHAGGKFDKSVYKVSGGLHGVGVSVVNALSEWLEVKVYRDNKIYCQKYAKGIPVTPVQTLGETNERGTEIRFKPDNEILETTEFDFNVVTNRLRECAFLNSGVRIVARNNLTGTLTEFYYENGLADFLKYITEGDIIIGDKIYFSDSEKYKKDAVFCNVALAWTHGYSERILSFVNNIRTIDGGTHETGFKKGIARAFSEYFERNKIKEETTGEDLREGLVAIINMMVPNPEFEGQTKGKLGNSEISTIVSDITYKQIGKFLEENKAKAKEILEKIFEATRAREAARKARELVRRKSALLSTTLPGKLADCSSNNPTICELFCVEGDSAAGSSKQARSRETQAILPLRGKILNVEKATLDKILNSEEIKNLITALGTNFGENFNIEKLRYHKMIMMTDGDSDGSHIQTLLLTLFYRYMKQLIERGYVYIAQPPLYKIVDPTTKGSVYFYNDKDLNSCFANLKEQKIDVEKIHTQRFKGLGEMNADQLWETTMDPKKRVLKKVTIGDAIEADRLFSILMGEKVEPRKDYIVEHALEVKELDV